MRYAVVQDFAAQPLLLLFDAQRDQRPEVVVPLSHLPDTPLTGSADVHGQVVPGDVVVVRAGQTLLYPDGPVLAIDEDEPLAVLNDTTPWETE